MNILYRALIYILMGLAVIYAYIKYMELRGIFYPVKQIEISPKNINIVFNDIYLKTEDNANLNGWFIPYDNAKYTLIFFHGNAGNISNRLDKISLLREIGLNIFIIDYRGYGKSTGMPSEQGFYSDATAAYKYLVNTLEIAPKQIILYGESLGGAPAINLAATSEVRAIILEGAFSSGKDMARIILPFFPGFFFLDKFNSLKKMPSIKAAKLFIHTKEDEVVPINLAKKLFNCATDPKFFAELNGTHNNACFFSEKEYISAIKSFINNLEE